MEQRAKDDDQNLQFRFPGESWLDPGYVRQTTKSQLILKFNEDFFFLFFWIYIRFRRRDR
jgi:hypothetical protein